MDKEPSIHPSADQPDRLVQTGMQSTNPRPAKSFLHRLFQVLLGVVALIDIYVLGLVWYLLVAAIIFNNDSWSSNHDPSGIAGAAAFWSAIFFAVLYGAPVAFASFLFWLGYKKTKPSLSPQSDQSNNTHSL